MKGKKITMAGAFVSYEGQKKLVSYEGQKICYIVMNQLVMNGKKITMAGGFVSYKGQRQTKEKKKHNEKKKCVEHHHERVHPSLDFNGSQERNGNIYVAQKVRSLKIIRYDK